MVYAHKYIILLAARRVTENGYLYVAACAWKRVKDDGAEAGSHGTSASVDGDIGVLRTWDVAVNVSV